MDISTHIIELKTEGYTQMLDISDEVRAILRVSPLQEGQACVFGIGSTTGITTVEYEPGLAQKDVKEMLEEMAPYRKNYAHNQTWGDDNENSHLRSFMVGTSFNVPFVKGELVLGMWQQIVFVDFDTRPRERKVVVQLMGK
ncbi:MAG: secondary thiamine-phosphate synthase enzyme YjbQ [Bacteroidota bacterium]